MSTRVLSVEQSLDFIMENMLRKGDVQHFELKLDGLAVKIGTLEERFDALDEKVDAIAAHIDTVESNLGAGIEKVSDKLDKFEEFEIDKRMQLEVRTNALEKHLSLKPPVGTTN